MLIKTILLVFTFINFNTSFAINILDIPKSDYNNIEEKIEYFNKIKSPVLIKKAVINWQAFKLWDLDYFKNNYGKTLLPVQKKESLTNKKWGE